MVRGLEEQQRHHARVAFERWLAEAQLGDEKATSLASLPSVLELIAAQDRFQFFCSHNVFNKHVLFGRKRLHMGLARSYNEFQEADVYSEALVLRALCRENVLQCIRTRFFARIDRGYVAEYFFWSGETGYISDEGDNVVSFQEITLMVTLGSAFDPTPSFRYTPRT